MASCICEGCGKQTNSAVSRYWSRPRNMEGADGCFARVSDNNRWETGCCYNDADVYTRPFVDKMLGKKAIKTLDEIRAEAIGFLDRDK